MGATVCKFRCISKTETADGYSIVMMPVTGGSVENEQFFKYTPGGRFEVSIVRPETAAQYEVGKHYRITLEEMDA